jgi:hypothetical protein
MMFFTKQTDVIAVSDGASFHFDPTVDNAISRQYAEWLAEGNEPQEWQTETDGE